MNRRQLLVGTVPAAAVSTPSRRGDVEDRLKDAIENAVAWGYPGLTDVLKDALREIRMLRNLARRS